MLEEQIGGLKKLSQMTKPKEAMRIFHNDGKVIQEAKSKDPCQDLELKILQKVKRKQKPLQQIFPTSQIEKQVPINDVDTAEGYHNEEISDVHSSLTCEKENPKLKSNFQRVPQKMK